MDEQYIDYFGQRADDLLSGQLPLTDRERFLETFGGPPLERPDHQAALSAVQSARSAVGEHRRLRADAELVIYLLSSELVAKPLIAGGQAVEVFTSDLSSDAATVASAGADTADATEVSAHQIIDGLSHSWDKLAIARWRVWDRHAE